MPTSRLAKVGLNGIGVTTTVAETGFEPASPSFLSSRWFLPYAVCLGPWCNSLRSISQRKKQILAADSRRCLELNSMCLASQDADFRLLRPASYQSWWRCSRGARRQGILGGSLRCLASDCLMVSCRYEFNGNLWNERGWTRDGQNPACSLLLAWDNEPFPWCCLPWACVCMLRLLWAAGSPAGAVKLPPDLVNPGGVFKNKPFNKLPTSSWSWHKKPRIILWWHSTIF